VLHVLLPLFEDEGAGADRVLGEVAVPLYQLLVDHHRPGTGDVADERCVRFRHLDCDSGVIRRVDAGDAIDEEVGVLELARLARHLPLKAVLDVGRCHLPTVGRRHVLELDPLADFEGIGERIRLLRHRRR
jgi:hypothetical protein